MTFLLFWVAHCNWKWTVRVTVRVEERKFLCVKENVLYPCLLHSCLTKRKLAAVTETACPRKDKLQETASVLTRKET